MSSGDDPTPTDPPTNDDVPDRPSIESVRLEPADGVFTYRNDRVVGSPEAPAEAAPPEAPPEEAD